MVMEKPTNNSKVIKKKTMALQYLDMMKGLGSSNSTKYIIPMEFTEMFKPFTETLRAASSASNTSNKKE